MSKHGVTHANARKPVIIYVRINKSKKKDMKYVTAIWKHLN